MSSVQAIKSAHAPSVATTDIVSHLSGTLENIYISSGHDYWGKQTRESLLHGVQDLPEVECVEGRGLRGDRYFNGKLGKLGQVTFFQAEVVDAIRERFHLPELSAAVFRRNLIVRGICLQELLGRRFTFQGITFEGAQECKPCVWMDRAVAMGVQSFMRDCFRGGLRARVFTTGVLKVADRCESCPQPIAPISKAAH